MARTIPGLRAIGLLALILLSGCAETARPELDAGTRLFRENRIEEALPHFEAAAALDGADSEALAWLAETRRRLGDRAFARETSGRALEIDPRSAFAHVVAAETLFPYGERGARYDTVWYHVEQALASDSTDGNAWLLMWAREIFRGDVEGWADGRRQDGIARPIAFAVTVEESFYADYADRLVDAGAFRLLRAERPSSPADTAAIRAGLESIRPGAFRGPWVSEADRSPVRRVYTKQLATNVTRSAVTLAQRLAADGRDAEALELLDWADAYERETELGPALSTEIAEERARLQGRGSRPGG